jgi:hypothetical protein
MAMIILMDHHIVVVALCVVGLLNGRPPVAGKVWAHWRMQTHTAYGLQ